MVRCWCKKFLYIFIAICSYLLYVEGACAVTEVSTVTNSDSEIKSRGRTVVISPPPSAISPSMGGSSSDICTAGVSGAVQTQILGISSGETVRDENCERLKISKTLYDMGMKVAAVSVMCQDKRVFDAMMNAGTPCPYDGLIGDDAKAAWKVHSGEKPQEGDQEPKVERTNDEKTLFGTGLVFGLLLLLLL